MHSTCPVKPKESVLQIKPYVAGKTIKEVATEIGINEDAIVKLASNENPYGASPEVIDVMKSAVSLVNYYPEPDDVELRELIGDYVSVDPELILPTAGMDGLIDALTRAYLNVGESALVITPTFSYYEIAILANGANVINVPRDDDFVVPIDDVIEVAREQECKIVFLCSPNNPTGDVISKEQITKLSQSLDSLIFLDEAYVEFAKKSLLSDVLELSNVVVGRTFSKAFGLAGLRIGYGIAPPDVIDVLKRSLTPFSVSLIAQHAAKAALRDREYLNNVIQKIVKTRSMLYNTQFKTFESEANFVLLDVSPLNSTEATSWLLERGLIVRDCSTFPGMGNSFIRVSVGTHEQTKMAVELLDELYDTYCK